MNEQTEKVLDAIRKERERQDSMWGIQEHDMSIWLMILMEEIGEFAQALQADKGWGKPSDANNRLEEIIHVAAVSTRMAELLMEETK